MPKSYAVLVPVDEDLGGIDSDYFDDLWLAYQVCKGKQIPISTGESTSTTIDPETGEEVEVTNTTSTNYTEAHFNNCCGYTKSCQNLSVNQLFIEDLFQSSSDKRYQLCGSNNLSYLVDNLLAQSDKPDFQSYCNTNLAGACAGNKTIDGTTYSTRVTYSPHDGSNSSWDSDEEYSDDPDETVDITEGEEEVGPPSTEVPGECKFSTSYNIDASDIDDTQFEAVTPDFPASWCTDNGYVNMKNFGATKSIDCQCNNAATALVLSTNNEKMCVPKCPKSSQLPYARYTVDATGKEQPANPIGKCCDTDYNPQKMDCCPEKSLYDPTAGGCVCVGGYKMNTAETECNLEYCPAGSHPTPDGVCVVNPPITQARRFCELITEQWNISDSYCGSFDTNSQSQDTYLDVYNAALGTNNKFLSVTSKPSAFKTIKPNIVFTNGLKMWILGDKAASIPGLSYYNTSISKTQNMCFKKDLGSETTASKCYGAGGDDAGYFCKHENTCLKLDPASKASGAIKDARTCCATLDTSDLQEEAKASGANWKTDPRAYAIAGFTIFVDIDGDKGDGTLWDDVYPFFVGSDGVVYPAYPLDAPKGNSAADPDLLYDGGNNAKFLPVDVYYYLPTDKSRQRRTAFSSVSYARGVCSARKVSQFTPYCLNLGEKFNGGNGFTSAACPTSGGCTSSTKLTGNAYIQVSGKESRNPCDHYNCFVAVRRKLKSF